MSTTVITGLGIAAANGLGVPDYWNATISGISGLGQPSTFPAETYNVLVGEVPGFVAKDHVPSRLLPQTDHSTRLSLAAAAEAATDAALDAVDLDDYQVGISTASSMGGFAFGQRELQNLWNLGAEHVSAYQSFAWFYAVNTGQISIRQGLKGPGSALVTDHAGGIDTIGHARRQIRKGTSVMFAGGVDGALCPLGVAGHLSTERISRSADPAQAYLPFDQRASGHVAGEGGAILVVEDLDHALERGSTPYAAVSGYSATFDPGQWESDPDALVRAIRGALADASVQPGDVDVVFADAAGSPELDRSEATALRTVFGESGVAVTAPKTMVGRLYAGGASLDVATAALSIRDGIIPPTINTRPLQDHGIDLVVAGARYGPVRHALILARGDGGFTSALVLSAIDQIHPSKHQNPRKEQP